MKNDHAGMSGMQLTFDGMCGELFGAAAVQGGREREAAGRGAVQKQCRKKDGSTCNGCKKLKIEEWPHGAIAVRCMDVSKGRWYGRVLHYSAIGKIASVQRPKWCSDHYR